MHKIFSTTTLFISPIRTIKYRRFFNCTCTKGHSRFYETLLLKDNDAKYLGQTGSRANRNCCEDNKLFVFYTYQGLQHFKSDVSIFVLIK